MDRWERQRDEANRQYRALARQEQIIRDEARHFYAHPDDANYEGKIWAGIFTYPTIITQFGRWAITFYGLECLNQFYTIPAAELNNDWIRHLSNKEWVDDLTVFATALYHARAIHTYLGHLQPCAELSSR
jgi:hypothetical protein